MQFCEEEKEKENRCLPRNIWSISALWPFARTLQYFFWCNFESVNCFALFCTLAIKIVKALSSPTLKIQWFFLVLLSPRNMLAVVVTSFFSPNSSRFFVSFRIWTQARIFRMKKNNRGIPTKTSSRREAGVIGLFGSQEARIKRSRCTGWGGRSSGCTCSRNFMNRGKAAVSHWDRKCSPPYTRTKRACGSRWILWWSRKKLIHMSNNFKHGWLAQASLVI